MNTKKPICFLTCASLAIAAGIASANEESGHGLRVNIEGLRNNRGQVICALFASADDFPKRIDKAFARTAVQISDVHAICEFSAVPPGVYAVSVFHDENSNDKLDTNWLGIPREGVGASSNPKPRMGPPKFAAAKFQYVGKPMDIDVVIHYL
jgi:uncharacterized protein (DUF2141 family)